MADVNLVWRLMCLPIDFDPPRSTRWLELSRLALRHLAGRRTFARDLLPDVPSHGAVEVLEGAAAAARDVRALLRQVPGVAGLAPEQVRDVEIDCAARITALLPESMRNTAAGRCRSCSRPCPPWAPVCDDCRDRPRPRTTTAPAPRRARSARRS